MNSTQSTDSAGGSIMFVNHTDVRMVRTEVRGGLNLVYNLYEMKINEKPVAPPLDIPSRSPDRIGISILASFQVRVAAVLKPFDYDISQAH